MTSTQRFPSTSVPAPGTGTGTGIGRRSQEGPVCSPPSCSSSPSRIHWLAPALGLPDPRLPQEPFVLATLLFGLVVPALVQTYRQLGGFAAGVAPGGRGQPAPILVRSLAVGPWSPSAFMGGRRPLRRREDAHPLLLDATVLYLTSALIVNIWEEMAWTGFFQRRTMARWGLIAGSAATGVVFARSTCRWRSTEPPAPETYRPRHRHPRRGRHRPAPPHRPNACIPWPEPADNRSAARIVQRHFGVHQPRLRLDPPGHDGPAGHHRHLDHSPDTPTSASGSPSATGRPLSTPM